MGRSGSLQSQTRSLQSASNYVVHAYQHPYLQYMHTIVLLPQSIFFSSPYLTRMQYSLWRDKTQSSLLLQPDCGAKGLYIVCRNVELHGYVMQSTVTSFMQWRAGPSRLVHTLQRQLSSYSSDSCIQMLALLWFYITYSENTPLSGVVFI